MTAEPLTAEQYTQSAWIEARTDLDAAHSWGMRKGIVTQRAFTHCEGTYFELSLRADEALAAWPTWTWKEKAWFECLAEDENLHRLTKYLDCADRDGVAHYLG